MFSRHHRKVRLFFAFADAAIILLAFQAAYAIRESVPLPRNFRLDPAIQVMLSGAAALLWVALAYWLEIYDRLDSGHPRIVLRDTFRQCAWGGAGMVIVQFAARLDLSRVFLGLFLLFCWALLCIVRLNAGGLAGRIRREFGATHYVAVVGSGERAESIAALLRRSAATGIQLIETIGERDAARRLPLLLKERVVDEVIFAVGAAEIPALEELFLLCDEEGVRTRLTVDFLPHVHSDVFLDRLGSAPLLTFSAAPHDEIRLAIKRVLDIVLAATAIVLLLPFMAVIALAIRLSSPGPAIFRQVRCGLNGRPFLFYKFRSMVDNAEELQASVEHLNEKTTAFKISNDPRLTPIGGFLRKFSVDEWPQLWNVLKGDMSLVGPRPAVPREVERYQRWQRRRLRMRPGLTCLWVLNGRDHLDFDTWMKMDMQYIDSWSLSLDLKILLKTVPQVLLGKGAN